MADGCYVGLLLFLCSALAQPLQSLEPVRLQVFERMHVKLLVGNPGRLLNFRINYTLDEIQLHTSLALLSQTYTNQLSSELLYFGQQFSSDLFYLGDYCLRLPFRYIPDNADPIAKLARPGPYTGTLGLGPYSPLWKYWRKATFSTESILLGGYDNYAQLDPNLRPPLLTHGRIRCDLDTGYVAELRLEPGAVDTYLPDESYNNQPKTIHITSETDCTEDYIQLGIEGSCSNELNLLLRPQSLYLSNQQQYIATKRSYDGTLRLGKRFIEDHTLFCDWEFDKAMLSSSSHSFSDSFDNALCAIMLIFLTSLWLTLVFSQPEEEWLFQLTLFLELYIYTVVVVTLFVNFYAMQWSRFLTNFLETSPVLVMLFFAYMVLSSVAMAIVLLYRHIRLPVHLIDTVDRHPQNVHRLYFHGDLRLFLFLSVALLGLWLCVLPNHRSGADLLYLLFFSTTVCVASGVLTVHNLWIGRPYSGVMAVHTLIFYWFLIYANVLPSTTALDLHDSKLLTVVLYVFAFVIFPTEVIFGKLILMEHKLAVEQQKK